MKICKTCGKQLADNVTTCDRCQGTDLLVRPSRPSNNNNINQGQRPNNMNNQNMNNQNMNNQNMNNIGMQNSLNRQNMGRPNMQRQNMKGNTQNNQMNNQKQMNPSQMNQNTQGMLKQNIQTNQNSMINQNNSSTFTDNFGNSTEFNPDAVKQKKSLFKKKANQNMTNQNMTNQNMTNQNMTNQNMTNQKQNELDASNQSNLTTKFNDNKADVLTVKDYILIWLKLLIPFYNFYYIIVVIASKNNATYNMQNPELKKKKVFNPNVRNYIIAWLIITLITTLITTILMVVANAAIISMMMSGM